ncbi:MAG TPA: hypothetical protein VN457_00335, partial [Chlamydiales bacterium]|nr:hypothetical protein [Chlamydiales bacterium]
MIPAVQSFCAVIGGSRLATYFQQMEKSYERFPEAIRSMYFAGMYTVKSWKTATLEFAEYEKSAALLKSRRTFLGNKPLIVITAGKPPRVDETGFSKEYIMKAKKAWNSLQRDLLTKSSKAKQVIAAESGHMVNHEEPRVIVEAVREILKK